MLPLTHAAQVINSEPGPWCLAGKQCLRKGGRTGELTWGKTAQTTMIFLTACAAEGVTAGQRMLAGTLFQLLLDGLPGTTVVHPEGSLAARKKKPLKSS